MIAMRSPVLALLLCILPTKPSAWAQEASDADIRAMDAEVELGVQAYNARDYQHAKAILMPLAERGHPWAMNMVGLMHDGTGVFPNDPVQECDWYERAANAGYAAGMYNLRICYSDGYGRANNPELDHYWLLLAADHGYSAAMINLAAQDMKQGEEYRRWMNLAAEHGSLYAPVSLWLQGYKDDAKIQGMPLKDFFCVSWRILIMNKHFDACDD